MTIARKKPAKPLVDAIKRGKAEEKPVKTQITSEKEAKHLETNANIYSISALSRRFKLDRATVRDRIEKAEIKPYSVKAKEKLYLLDDVEIILSQSELNEAKLKKTDAEAELKILELKKKSGEFASVADFTEIVQRMMSNFYSKTVVNLPTRIGSRLHNANSSAEVSEILKAELIKEWKHLRDNYPDYINDKPNRKSNR